MNENTQEKLLIQINKNNIFYKIKRFFKNLLYKETTIDNTSLYRTKNNIEVNITKGSFIESVRNTENEETMLLKLQKQFDDKRIHVKDLTDEQIVSLCALYDKQIENLKKSNEIRKKRLAEYRRKSQTDS